MTSYRIFKDWCQKNKQKNLEKNNFVVILKATDPDNHDFYYFVTSQWHVTISLKTDVIVEKSKKTLKIKSFLVGILKATTKKSRICNPVYGS
jgi:hypothetical protein